HLFAASADRDWRMRLLYRLGTVVRLFDRMVAALEIRALFGEQQLHNMKPLVELPKPRANLWKFVAVTPELLVHPARANTDFEAAVADMVDRSERLCEQRRIAKRVAQYQRADPDLFSARRERAHRRRAFEEIRLGNPAIPEMVDQPQRMIAEPFSKIGAVDQRLERHSGLWREDSEFDFRAHRSLRVCDFLIPFPCPFQFPLPVQGGGEG